MRRLALSLFCVVLASLPAPAQNTVKKDVQPQQTGKPAPPPDPDELGTPINAGSGSKPKIAPARKKRPSAQADMSDEASSPKDTVDMKTKSAETGKVSAKHKSEAKPD